PILYEKLSDNLHRYSPPSERNYYNLSAMASHGYFVLEPDIVFKPRDPGVSAVDCVTAAAKRVIQMGVVDPKRIGIMGHSWGGFDTTYLATHTDRKSTRLNSSHVSISYAVFCLKK